MNGLTENGGRVGVGDGSAKEGGRALTRIAAALKRRGKRDFETLEPVSAALDFSTLEAGGCAAIAWANAIAVF